MSSRSFAALAIALGACGSVEAPLVNVTGQATVPIALRDVMASPADTTFRWNLVVRPDGSTASSPPDGSPTDLVPDVRGIYLVELWTRTGLAEILAARYELDIAGMPPTAMLEVAPNANLGTSVTADAGQSISPEGRPLTFRWRLDARPRGSAAALASATDPTASFTPDVAGDYGLDLAVFDGELWSTTDATATVHATGP
jgi:hypothetical protein